MNETIAPTTTTLELRAAALRLVLRPDLGGCIAGFWHDDVAVLRSTEDASSLASSRLSGCYPLVPYSNRLGYRRFRWLGVDQTTQPNFDTSPHSLHGVAWQRPWRVLQAGERSAELAYHHDGDADWPYAFEVRQRLAIDEGGLEVRLVFDNLAPQAQPVGLGWHPYFPKRPRSRLHAECSERWDSDATGLPTRRVPQPGIDGDIAHLDFDHCFEGWRGAARIRDERLSLRLTSSLPYLVVFTPPLKDYYCVEPVSHVNNALHMADPMAHGLRSVDGGASTEAWMRLDVAPAR
jgi:aldose 1-epimerase